MSALKGALVGVGIMYFLGFIYVMGYLHGAQG